MSNNGTSIGGIGQNYSQAQKDNTYSSDPNTPLSFTPNMTEPDEKTLRMLREKFRDDFTRFMVTPVPVFTVPPDSLDTTASDMADNTTPPAISRADKEPSLDPRQYLPPSTPTRDSSDEWGGRERPSSNSNPNYNSVPANVRTKVTSMGGRESQGAGTRSSSQPDSRSKSEEQFNEVLNTVNNFPNCSNVIDDGYGRLSAGTRPTIYTGKIQTDNVGSQGDTATDNTLSAKPERMRTRNTGEVLERVQREGSDRGRMLQGDNSGRNKEEEFTYEFDMGDRAGMDNTGAAANFGTRGTGGAGMAVGVDTRISINGVSVGTELGIHPQETPKHNVVQVSRTNKVAPKPADQETAQRSHGSGNGKFELREINSEDDRVMSSESRENLNRIIQNRYAMSQTPTESEGNIRSAKQQANSTAGGAPQTKMETLQTYYSLKQMKTGSASSFATVTGFVNPAMPNTTVVNSTTMVNVEPHDATDTERNDVFTEAGKAGASVQPPSDTRQPATRSQTEIQHQTNTCNEPQQVLCRPLGRVVGSAEGERLPPFPVQPEIVNESGNTRIQTGAGTSTINKINAGENIKEEGKRTSTSSSSASVPTVIPAASLSTPRPVTQTRHHQADNSEGESQEDQWVEKHKHTGGAQNRSGDASGVDTIELDEYSSRSKRLVANSREDANRHVTEKIEIPRSCQHMCFESLLSVDEGKFYKELYNVDYRSSSRPSVSSATSIQSIKIRNSCLANRSSEGVSSDLLEMRINLVCNILGLVDASGSSSFLKTGRTERLNFIEKLLERNMFRIIPNETYIDQQVLSDSRNNRYTGSKGTGGQGEQTNIPFSKIEERQVSSVIVRIPPENEYYLRIAFCPSKSVVYSTPSGDTSVEMSQLLKQYFQEYIRCSSFIESASMSKTITSLNDTLHLKAIMSVFIHTGERIYRIGPHTGSVLLRTDIKQMFTKLSVPPIQPLTRPESGVTRERKGVNQTLQAPKRTEACRDSISAFVETKLPRNVITVNKAPEAEESDERHNMADESRGAIASRQQHSSQHTTGKATHGVTGGKTTLPSVPVFVKPSTLLFRQEHTQAAPALQTHPKGETFGGNGGTTTATDAMHNQVQSFPGGMGTNKAERPNGMSQVVKFKFFLNENSVKGFDKETKFVVRFEVFEKRFNINNINRPVPPHSETKNKTATNSSAQTKPTNNIVVIDKATGERCESHQVTNSESRSVNVVYGIDNIIYTDDKGHSIIDNKSSAPKLATKHPDKLGKEKQVNTISVISDRASFKIRPIDVDPASLDEMFESFQESIVMRDIVDGTISSIEVIFLPNQRYLKTFGDNRGMPIIFGVKLVASLYSVGHSASTVSEQTVFTASNRLIAEFQVPLWGIVMPLQTCSLAARTYNQIGPTPHADLFPTMLSSQSAQSLTSTANTPSKQTINGMIISTRRTPSGVGIGIELKVLSLRTLPVRVTLKVREKELYNFVVFARERRTLKLELGNISDRVVLTVVCTDECLRQIASITGTWTGLDSYAYSTSSVTDIIIE